MASAWARLIPQHVQPGERALVLGAGWGHSGAACMRASGVPAVLVEPHAALWPLIARQVERDRARSGCAATLVRGAVVPSSCMALTVPFYVAQDPLRGSLRKRAHANCTEVPAFGLDTLLQDHRPQVLAISIEGLEAALVGESLPAALQGILLDIHTDVIGDAAERAVLEWIVRQGFRAVEVQRPSWVFRRRR